MQALNEVKSWMRFFGWTNDGGPGSVKCDANDRIVARHGDATWIADCDSAIERIERAKIVAEIERRDHANRVHG